MLRFLVAAALMIATFSVYAQAPVSTGPVPSTPQVDPTTVPLDGAASLLLASGIAYGLKRLRNRSSH